MTPTAREQLMLELVNRARMDPAAEAARYGINLNSGLAPGTISSTPKQPLAWNADLQEAAEAHSQWMLATDTFSHTGAGGSSVGDRVSAEGYDWWTVGENISWRGSTGSMDYTAAIVMQHESLFLSAGHRRNILNDNFAEIGVAQEFGKFEIYSSSSMVTQNYGDRRGDPEILLGVVIDDRDNDDFYDIGEGLGGVTVKATGSAGTFTTVTYDAGGYSLELPSGTYDVTFSGGGLGGTVSRKVTIGDSNVKLDVETDDVSSGGSGGGSQDPGDGSGGGSDGGSGGGSWSDLFIAWLIDALADRFLGRIRDGATLDVADVSGSELTVMVEANPDGPLAGEIESVSFDLDDGAVRRTENFEPYALFGDQGGDDFGSGKGLGQGKHSLDIAAHPEKGAKGGKLAETTLDFTLKDSGAAANGLRAWIMDADSDRMLAELSDGAELAASTVAGRNVTVLVAVADPSLADAVDSIVFDLDDGAVRRTENFEPYAMFGDDGAQDLKGGMKLGAGSHELELEAWSKNGGAGQLLEDVSFDFDLV